MKLNKLLMGFVLQDVLSPPHMASQKGHLDVVKTLNKAGANINQANKVSTHTYPCKVQHLAILLRFHASVLSAWQCLPASHQRN